MAALDLQLALASPLQQQLEAREDGAVLAVLEHTTSGRQLVVASCHLYYNPQWPDIKLLQAHILCGRVAAMLQQHSLGEDSPVLIGGDFNSLATKHEADCFDPEVTCVERAAIHVAEHICYVHDQRSWPASTQRLPDDIAVCSSSESSQPRLTCRFQWAAL